MNEFAGLPWWGWTLIVVGFVAIVAVIAALFLPDWGEHDFTCSLDEPAGTERFLGDCASTLNVPVLRGGTTRLLQNGDEIYPALLEAIRSAKKFVHFMVYIFDDDEIGKQFVAAFEERARAGVEVRLLLDGFGCWKFPKEQVERLKQAGCKVEFFRPVRFHNLARAFKRNHRRAIVIDGRVAFTGGAAISKKWDGNARNEHEWRDNLTRMTGALASGIQAAFGNTWVYCTGEVLAGETYYPVTAVDETPGPACGIVVISSPGDTTQPTRLLLWLAFTAARERLYICNSYFIPDKRLRDAVKERAKRGVDVRILVPGPKTDAKPVRLAGRGFYEDLMCAGVRIFEYQPTMMHAKNVTIDGRWAIVGSANMDERSMELNEEIALGVVDENLATSIERGMLADFDVSREVDLEEFRKRPWLHRFGERACSLLIEQY